MQVLNPSISLPSEPDTHDDYTYEDNFSQYLGRDMTHYLLPDV
jgi:hypothetical protein